MAPGVDMSLVLGFVATGWIAGKSFRLRSTAGLNLKAPSAAVEGFVCRKRLLCDDVEKESTS